MPANAPWIVVVDDDPDLRTLMLDLLSLPGYAVFTWNDAHGAQAEIQRVMPALVIVDLRMEHPTAGLDVLRVLQADTLTTAIPAILYSATLDTLDGERDALHAAGVSLVQKPFDPVALLNLVAAKLQ